MTGAGRQWHRERFRLLGSVQDLLLVACDCELRRSHDYVEWLHLPGNEQRLLRALQVWAAGARSGVAGPLASEAGP